MTKREEIQNLIGIKNIQIRQLYDEIRELRIDNLKFCDENQWYIEKEEEQIIKKRPKTIEKSLIGRVYWKEDFKDESSDDVVTVERNMIVRKDRFWYLHLIDMINPRK